MKRIIYILLLSLSFSTVYSVESQNGNKTEIKHLTTNDFLKEINNFKSSNKWQFLGDKPVIIDFYATWCGPCRKLSPILSEIAQSHPEITVYKVNVDEEPELAQFFSITSIPLVVYIPMKGKPFKEAGLVAKEDVEQNIINIFKTK
ncbi:MAG: thioredoxin domain-containing protein [Bacteroidales bacterium]|nr:thioredoxin domain-containing protein [Bacteroidales bacterium]